MFDRVWRISYPALVGLLLLGLLWHHWQIVVTPVPLDLYEGTMLLITGIIADGDNPYTRAFQPAAADVYPPLYNMLVAPLTAMFGNTFQLHRAVSALFILAATAMAAIAARRNSGSWRDAFAAGAMLYAALLFYATPVSSTNAPGVAVFLAGLIVPWWRGFSTGSLVFAALCGLLAFYTKQYFILCMAILCLYLFLYVSMGRALLLGVCYAACLLLSLVIVHQTSPYYLDNTLFAPSAAMSGLQSWEILLVQLGTFVRVYAGLLLVMLLSAGASLLLRWRDGRQQTDTPGNWFRPARAGWGGPLLARQVDFFWFCLFWSSLVFLFWLGRNPGNYMTYLFQLVSPFLLIVAFEQVARLPRGLKYAAPLVLWSAYQCWAVLHKDFSADMDNWREMEDIIAGGEDILASQMLVASLLQQGKPVLQDGHTFYFPLAVHKPEWMRKPRPEDRVETVWADYIEDLYRRIERRELDLILVSPWEMRGIFLRNPPPFEDVPGKEFLQRHYRIERRIALSMTDRHGGGTYDIQVWRPKPARRPAGRSESRSAGGER